MLFCLLSCLLEFNLAVLHEGVIFVKFIMALEYGWLMETYTEVTTHFSL